MPTTHRTITTTLTLLAIACADKTNDESALPDDSGSDSASASSKGLPEGSSTWSGRAEFDGVPFALSVELENTLGDLTGTATFSDDPEEPSGLGTFAETVIGTHEPISGQLAVAGLDWVGEAPPAGLTGFLATYDPTTQTINGTLGDWTSIGTTRTRGGPVTLSLDSGDGEPTQDGERQHDLSPGSHAATGTMVCTGPTRDVLLAFDYDGAGSVVGQLTLGDNGLDTPLGTFEVSGVFNPSTGGMTLLPGLWIEATRATSSLGLDATYDASTGEFNGSLRASGNECKPDTWLTTIE